MMAPNTGTGSGTGTGAGIRQKLNQSPIAVIALVVIAVGVAAFVVFRQVKPSPPPGTGKLDWFTNDDGQTWFADDVTKPPPFMKDGKEAVRAYVFQCGRKKFVAYMQRLTPEGLKVVEEIKQAGRKPVLSPTVIGTDNFEVKRPGGKWVKLNGPREELLKISSKTCPDGASEGEVVFPP